MEIGFTCYVGKTADGGAAGVCLLADDAYGVRPPAGYRHPYSLEFSLFYLTNNWKRLIEFSKIGEISRVWER